MIRLNGPGVRNADAYGPPRAATVVILYTLFPAPSQGLDFRTFPQFTMLAKLLHINQLE
jgi:hypothetical protein